MGAISTAPSTQQKRLPIQNSDVWLTSDDDNLGAEMECWFNTVTRPPYEDFVTPDCRKVHIRELRPDESGDYVRYVGDFPNSYYRGADIISYYD